MQFFLTLFHCLIGFQLFSFFCVFSFPFFFLSFFRAPLSARSNGNCGPGSEYSLPPSYRARNNLLRIPAIIGGSSANNTNSISITQTRHANNDTSSTTTTDAIIDSKMSKSSTDIQDIDRLFMNANSSGHAEHDTITTGPTEKSMEIGCGDASNTGSNAMDDDTKAIQSSNGNDLVTIVTITGCTTTESSTGGEMDILAHL